MEISRKQNVNWEPFLSRNDRDDKVYGPALTVPARVELHTKDVIGKDGEVTTTQHLVLMSPANQPQIEDLLDGRQVIAVTQQITVQGQTVGWIAFTR